MHAFLSVVVFPFTLDIYTGWTLASRLFLSKANVIIEDCSGPLVLVLLLALLLWISQVVVEDTRPGAIMS